MSILLMLVSSCRGDEYIVFSEETDTGGEVVLSDIVGMYVLNEGNMGSNKATVDYLDLSGNHETVRYFATSIRNAIRIWSRSWATWAMIFRYTAANFGWLSTAPTR